MIASTDYTGIAALVAAFTGLVTAVFAGMATLRSGRAANASEATHAEIQTGNGHTLGEQSTIITAKVAPEHVDEMPHDGTPPVDAAP